MKKICCLKNPQHSVNDIDIIDTKNGSQLFKE